MSRFAGLIPFCGRPFGPDAAGGSPAKAAYRCGVRERGMSEAEREAAVLWPSGRPTGGSEADGGGVPAVTPSAA
jgi:hypothetical protein